MLIQLVTENRYTSEDIDRSQIVVSSLNAPNSFDDFDINIVDLSNPYIWRNAENSYQTIDSISDLKSICTIINNKTTSKVVIAFPQNIELCYNRNYQGGYNKSIQLKDMIHSLSSNIIFKILPNGCYPYDLYFEPTHTKVGNIEYTADFYFDTPGEVITQSSSQKHTTTTLNDNGVFATTLNLANSLDELKYFVKTVFEPAQKESAPKWINDISFSDDQEQKSIISKCEETIRDAAEKIDVANQKLIENNKYKSILYTNGDELVSVVFEILEKILGCDLSGFVDEKKEDFLIQLPSCTFIGEIKGVNTNVKSEHISQVDVHYQGYMDKLAEESKSEDVHEILILNPFKTKAPSEREQINETQVKLAERNECLIIETSTLLRIFEKYLNSEIDTEKCVEVFSAKTGLLRIEDFE